MNAFIWNSLFETGIASVDAQHQQLVDIINRLGVALISRNENTEVTDSVYAELSNYALHHFADEEDLMTRVGLDPAHVLPHQLHHQQFVEQLGALWAGRSQLSQPVDALLGFLCSWLTFHILEEDQRMARQIERVRQGMSPAEALACEGVRIDVGSAALLAAMRELYRLLAQQNAALANANARLEDAVRARTGELIQSVKMAAIGQLAAGVAHEINNPIGFVSSNLSTLRRYATQLLEVIDACGDCAAADASLASKFAAISNQVRLSHLRDDLPALLDETRDGLDRVKHIVQALQDFAHADSGEKHATDLVAGLRNTLEIAENQIAQRAEIRCELTPLPAVRCSPGLINQVFMNLLVNAAQSMVQRGVITLRSGFDATGVWIEVNDTGCGIGADQMGHLFEPFYTTKPVGQGTGLGLSTSWDIVVKQHGGRIDVHSTSGQGSSFTVWLPR